MGLDTKALRERNQLLSSGAALDACEAADEIDSLRAQLAKAQGYAGKLELDVSGLKGTIEKQVDYIHELQDKAAALKTRDNTLDKVRESRVRAAAMEEADRHLRQHDSALADVLDLEGLSATPATVVCVPVEVLAERVRAGHNDTCGAVLSSEPYPCSCGHAALAEMAKVTP